MANGLDPRVTTVPEATRIGRGNATVDVGMRSYMLSVYNYMASGVLLTGIVALLSAIRTPSVVWRTIKNFPSAARNRWQTI